MVLLRMRACQCSGMVLFHLLIVFVVMELGNVAMQATTDEPRYMLV